MITVQHAHADPITAPYGYKYGEKPKIEVPPGLFAVAAGHRPHRAGGYTTATWREMCRVAALLIQRYKPRTVLSGLELGWNQAVAYEALRAGTPVTAVLAFEGQESPWPDKAKQFYYKLLSHPLLTCRQYHAGGWSSLKVLSRNRALAEEADLCFALVREPLSSAGALVSACRAYDCHIVNAWPLFSPRR